MSFTGNLASDNQSVALSDGKIKVKPTIQYLFAKAAKKSAKGHHKGLDIESTFSRNALGRQWPGKDIPDSFEVFHAVEPVDLRAFQMRKPLKEFDHGSGEWPTAQDAQDARTCEMGIFNERGTRV